MKKRWIWIGAGLLVLIALIGTSVAKQSQGKVTAVQMARIRKEDITSRVRAPGKIEAKTQVNISADIMGKVVVLRVKEGDRVKRGELMLQLEDTPYRSAAAQARASLTTAQARKREADRALTAANSNFERQQSLYQQNLLSPAEWDNANTSHESAVVNAATAADEIARSRAALESAENSLSKCRFTAPFDGVVSALNVEAGEIVITGTMNNAGTQIMTVSDLSRMLVRADVDETDIVDMTHQQKAKISVDAMPDTTFNGTVTEIGNTAKRSITSAVEGQTNFEVKVVFDDNVPQVRPGMTADVEIETATHTGVLSVPIQAVVVRSERDLERAKREGGKGAKAPKAPKPKKGATVAAEDDTAGRKDKEIAGLFVVRNDIAEFVPVRTGIASESSIEVVGEIKEGESIVSGPYKALRELKPKTKVKQEAAGGRGKK